MAEVEAGAVTAGGPQGGPSSSSGSSQSQPAGGAASQTSAEKSQSASGGSSQTQIQTRPEWAPEQYWDATKGSFKPEFGTHYSDLATRMAAEQVRRNALPQKAEDIKLDLPKDFQLPQGMEFKLDQATPELGKFRDVALKRGLDQDTITDLLGVYAETQVASKHAIDTARAAEVAKLGANGATRVTALETFFTGLLGADDAKAIGSMLVSARIVQAAEKIAAKFANQGAASFSQAHRDAEVSQSPSDDQWKAMSAAERLDYARRHDQSKFVTNGTGR